MDKKVCTHHAVWANHTEIRCRCHEGVWVNAFDYRCKIADMANARYVAVAPHCIVSPIGTIASDHVAAVPNFLALESHGMSVAFWTDM